MLILSSRSDLVEVFVLTQSVKATTVMTATNSVSAMKKAN